MHVLLRPAAVSFLTLSLAACGGGGGSNDDDSGKKNSGAATISSENSNAFARVAANVVVSTITQQMFSNINLLDDLFILPFGIEQSSPMPPLQQDLLKLASFVQQQTQGYSSTLPVGIKESFKVNGECGGSAIFAVDGEDLSASFTDYCGDNDVWGGNGEIINGSMSVVVDESDSVVRSAMTFSDLSVIDGDDSSLVNGTFTTEYNGKTGASSFSANMILTENGDTESLNTSASCDSDDNCTMSANYIDDKGKEYGVDELSFSETDGAVNISARITDPEYGYFSIQASNIQSCDNGNIAAGAIELTDNDNSLSVGFDGDCETMQVNYNGIAVTADQ